ncbi:MAG: hypothetical protein Q9182_004983 [Xanthomendoza sp. 2 TL-2023]
MLVGLDRDLRAESVDTGIVRSVTVNRRDLIDKHLARYSRPWSTLRELIQNAADAAATSVTIKITTKPSLRVPTPQSDDPSTQLKHVLYNHTVELWKVGNNGQTFRPEDWARLQDIATGNPDEDKIGAFGVGFYSVFDISENPWVYSGTDALQFYYTKDNDLVANRRKLPKRTDTFLELPARDSTSSVPHGQELFSLCQFLVSSMTFGGLQTIQLLIDDWRILSLRKSRADPVTLEIPGGLDKTTPGKFMRVSQITQEGVQVEAEWMKVLDSRASLQSGPATTNPLESTKKSVFSFFKRAAGPSSQSNVKPEQDIKSVADKTPQDLAATSKHKTFFHVNKATIVTNVDRDLGTEFLKLRKKPPPKSTTISFLAQSYDQSAASSLNASPVASKLFKSIVPDGKGHIYVGFSTSQTSGLAAHLNMPALVPTVEREQLDLNSKHIKTWNIELLRAAGLVARISWSAATMELQERLSKYPGMTGGKVLAPEELQEILPAVKWKYETFDWSSTFPLPDVGRYIQDVFWDCAKDFSLFSTRGFVPLDNVRVTSADLSFVEELPIVPESLLQLGLVKRLRREEVLTDVQINDIVYILEKSKKTRTPMQLQQLLAYLATKARANTISQREIQSVLNATVATDDELTPTRILALNDIKEFVNPDRIPPDMPLPPTTIPFKYTKKLSKFDTDALGFQELGPLKWLKWLTEDARANRQLPPEQNMEANSAFASKVLKTLSQNWSNMSQDTKTAMTKLLENRTIIPTKQGMKKPSETYFSSVKLFADLPVVENLNNVKEGFLSALGVRKVLEIGVVFDRLMSGSSQQWSHVDLIKYLASVWDDVPARDRERLKSTPVCPAEGLDGKPTQGRFQISELYEPNDALRRLGLPILQWPREYEPRSKEAKLLRILGLRDAPPYADLVNIIATAGKSADNSLREYALKYFIEHSQSKGYAASPTADVRTPFIPIQGPEDKLSAPADCFTNERAAVFGFSLLRSDLQKYAVLFGVQPDPPIDRCIERLIRKPPRSERQAREMFGYMTSRLGVIKNKHVEALGGANIVPVTTLKDTGNEGASRVRHLPPRMCFLGNGGELANMFDFVDFGKEAELFLMRCGSKHEVNITDIAYLFTQQPAMLMNELKQDRYLEVLMKMSREWKSIKKDKSLVEKLKQAPFLLATKVESLDQPFNLTDDDAKEDSKKWHLAKASEIVIIDEIGNYNLFKAHVLAAPQLDETLEHMYADLGTPGLTSLVEERQQIAGLEPGKRPDQGAALKLQSIILERARLFLHDYPADSRRHDSKWLEKNLTVQTVRSIIIKTSLRGTNIKHEQEKAATLRQDTNSRMWTICIIENYDMAQVSRALARLLLIRPRPFDWIVLEKILLSELRSLQEAGINVDRILQQKEKDAQMAHEMHQRQLEQERRARDEREALEQAMEAQGGRDMDSDVDSRPADPIPGDFPGNNDGKGHEVENAQEPAGLFDGFRKMLGFDPARKPQAASPKGERIEDDHDATEPMEPQRPDADSKQPLPPEPQGPPMTPDELSELSRRAIQTTRPHNASTVKGGPEVHEVKEAHTTCDPSPGTELIYSGRAANLRVLLDVEFIEASGTSKEEFMTTNAEGLKRFASILQDCAAIYKLPRESMNIFYDDKGKTIAFNQQNNVFFNYQTFRNNHLAMVEQGNRDLPIRSWALTTAHELAHNIEGDHNVRFHNVLQSIIESHIPNIADASRMRPIPATSPRQAVHPTRQPTPPPPRQNIPRPSGTAALKGTFKR